MSVAATAPVQTASTTTPTTRGRGGRSSPLSKAVFALTLLILTVVFLGPLAWMFLTSFKTPEGATSIPPAWVPNPGTVDGYRPLLDTSSETPVIRWFFNSLAAAAANSILVTVTAALAAYALARLDFPGKKLMFGLIIATLFIPGFLFLIPNYIIVNQLGWLDTLWAVIVPSAGGAFGVFFLRQFFLGLPVELEEAAEIDGCNRWQTFIRVVIPLSKPGLATLLVLSFLTNYNEFLWPVFVLFSPSSLTLPAGLSILQGAFTINYPVVMAGAVIASVPAIVLFILAQRSIVEGVSRSGLKG
jgi:multiple sugar transport system permease protein